MEFAFRQGLRFWKLETIFWPSYERPTHCRESLAPRGSHPGADAGVVAPPERHSPLEPWKASHRNGAPSGSFPPGSFAGRAAGYVPAMKKIILVLGAGIGFIAGSKAGNRPYQQIAAKVREVTKRPKPGAEEAVQPASWQMAAADRASTTEPISPVETSETLIPSTGGLTTQPVI